MFEKLKEAGTFSKVRIIIAVLTSIVSVINFTYFMFQYSHHSIITQLFFSILSAGIVSVLLALMLIAISIPLLYALDLLYNKESDENKLR